MDEAILPQEMIEHILTFLPVKTLLQLTTVCKRFRSLILHDPKFAKSQLHASCDRKTPSRKLLYSYKFEGPVFKSIDLETSSSGDPSSVREVKLPFVSLPTADLNILLLGSCNGIVFLTMDEEVFYMWNPSTNFFKKLPDPGFSPHRLCNNIYAYGVGYSAATDDYKLVGMHEYRINGKGYDDVIYYSTRADTWRRLDEIDHVPDVRRRGTFFKEALHWICQNEIVAFDLEEHKFRNMLLPQCFDHVDHKDHIFRYLGVLSTDQCMFFSKLNKVTTDCIQVWIMKEYDVRDSWTKLYNLKCLDSLKEPLTEIFVDGMIMETGMVFASPVKMRHMKDNRSWFAKIARNEDDSDMFGYEGCFFAMVEYQESLHSVEH